MGDDKLDKAGPDRRAVIGGGSAAIVAGAVSAQAQPAASSAPTARKPPERFAIVETTHGKVRGLNFGGIKQFRGIPYGAPTGGKNRFLPPRKPVRWAGVRDCFSHGDISPQEPASPKADYSRLIAFDQQGGGMGEDCLHLNVCTPGVGDGAKRPVMVCFHGGGFTTGSGNALMYYGDPLARYGDVVVVTPTHRLAAFGYLNLADLGAPAEFAQAGVVGMLDLVAALEWVRDNALAFGGDPSRVMIWGQSGGGGKTSTMMAIPKAKGLFHRAAVQSGPLLRVQTREDSAAQAAKLLGVLGLAKSRIADIQKLPWEHILDAQAATGSLQPGHNYSPVLDGTVIPAHPFDPSAPAVSADVPMIISSCLEDGAAVFANWNMDEAGLKAFAARFGANADRLLALYRYYEPTKAPYLIQAQIVTDAQMRRQVLTQAERKAALGAAPAYVYVWEWPTTAFGGKFGAVHATDVGTAFHSARGSMYGEEPAAAKMADHHAAAWVAFARTGYPNAEGLPKWEPYTADKRATMVFADEMRVENDWRGDLRKLWDEINPPSSPRG